MIEFEKPNIKCLEIDKVNHYGKFVCEPLEGYGVPWEILKKNFALIITRLRY